MGREQGCIFCEIVRGSAHCFPVDEDERLLCFMDLFPVSNGHTLIVTRDHYENVFETPAEVLAAIAARSRRIAHAIRKVFSPDGLAVVQLNGAAAGQTVFHYHLHLIPRRAGSPQRVHGRVKGEAAQLQANAEALREALKA